MTVAQSPDELRTTDEPEGRPRPGPSSSAPLPPAAAASAGYFPAAPMTAGPRPKSPALACVLSAVPGLGQIYVGYYGLGFLHAVVASSLFAYMVAMETYQPLLPMLVIFFIFFMLYNIVDAGRRAVLYNLAIAGVPGVTLPESVKMPRSGGSVFGGAALLVAGFVLLLNTRFGFSLEWLAEWWPAAPMLFGAYLILRALQERRETREKS